MTPQLCTFTQSFFPPQLLPLWKEGSMQDPKAVLPFGIPSVTAISDSARQTQFKSGRAELDWLFAPKVDAITLADRVLARLIQSEAHEPNLHLKSDYRQAFICLILAGRGNTEPFTVASYSVHGCHPDQVWPKVQAIRQAKLGREFSEWYDSAGMMRPDIPKKPSESILARGVGAVEETAEPNRGGDTNPIPPASVLKVSARSVGNPVELTGAASPIVPVSAPVSKSKKAAGGAA